MNMTSAPCVFDACLQSSIYLSIWCT